MQAELMQRQISTSGDEDFRTRIPEDAQRQNRGEFTAEELRERTAQAEVRDRRERARILNKAGFTPAMRDRTFASYIPTHTLQKAGVAVARAFVDSIGKHLAKDLRKLKAEDLRRIRGLMLWGSSGSGKSHLLQAICNAAALELPKPPRIGYIDCITLGTLDKRGKVELAEMISDVDLLALDDLDKGLSGDAPAWARDLLKSVLAIADKDRKIMLIGTTNYPLRPREAPENEGDDEQRIRLARCWAAQRTMPEYIIGRLDALFYWQEIDGPNARMDIEDDEEHWWIQ